MQALMSSAAFSEHFLLPGRGVDDDVRLRSSATLEAALESEFWRFLFILGTGLGLGLLELFLPVTIGEDDLSSDPRRMGPPPGLDLGVFKVNETSGLG